MRKSELGTACVRTSAPAACMRIPPSLHGAVLRALTAIESFAVVPGRLLALFDSVRHGAEVACFYARFRWGPVPDTRRARASREGDGCTSKGQQMSRRGAPRNGPWMKLDESSADKHMIQ